MNTRTTRVEILGQFAGDILCTALKNNEAKVDRQADLPFTPLNWKAFCDGIDKELEAYDTNRRFLKIWGPASLILFVGAVASMIALLTNEKSEHRYFFLFLLLCLLPFSAIMRKVLGDNDKIATNLKMVASRHTGGEGDGKGVKYVIDEEFMFLFVRSRAKKYFIKVHVDADVQKVMQQSQDVEAQTHPVDNFPIKI